MCRQPTGTSGFRCREDNRFSVEGDGGGKAGEVGVVSVYNVCFTGGRGYCLLLSATVGSNKISVIYINTPYQYTAILLSSYTTNEIYESYLLVRRQVRCLPVSLPADCSYAVWVAL